MDKKFQSYTLQDIIPLQQTVIDKFNDNVDKKLTLEQSLNSFTDQELFTYIFIASYQYFRESNGTWQSKKKSGIQALENAKSKFTGTKEEIIKDFTTDWDTIN